MFSKGLLNSPSKGRVQDFQIDTGILHWDGHQKQAKANSDSLDWSTPASSQGLDWSQPVSNQTSSGFDW